MTSVPALARTGERLVPDLQHDELVHAEHLARYRLAAQLVSDRRVLDAACGEGYGSALLAAAGARSVVGIDIDEQTVAHARARHSIDAQRGDVAKLPFPEASFDVVVSFETIEHIEEPERALAEFRRVLTPDGLLVISTPNKLEYTVENEFHVHEFTRDEFLALLGASFTPVRALEQQSFMTSAVLDAEGFAAADGKTVLDVELVKVAGAEPGRELYTVALCGGGTDMAVRQVAVMSEIYEAHGLAERTLEAERLLAAWVERATEAERLLGVAEERLRNVEGSFSWRSTAPLRAAMSRLRDWR